MKAPKLSILCGICHQQNVQRKHEHFRVKCINHIWGHPNGVVQTFDYMQRRFYTICNDMCHSEKL